MNVCRELNQIYDLLLDRYGPQYWWPGKTRDEIIIGAILTQNTNWKNVEKAINSLKSENLLALYSIEHSSLDLISKCIRSSGYYNQKAKRLKSIAHYFNQYGYQVFIEKSITNFRSELLSINGIGHETADSILLYAFDKPIFVIDAYTKRIFHRLGFLPKSPSYDDVQRFFMNNIQKDVKLFNEYHALIVRHAKECCQKIPQCSNCVLLNSCKVKKKIV
ncbi:MAG: endonuclease III domain-containing protein [Candidatus Cloacimonetes bacterium]|nr:endonuclease III domain-containing protein [Candidatus Cloacimonadota bacterium]